MELQGNAIGVRGFDAIATALSQCLKLQLLDVSGCNDGAPLPTEIIAKMCESIKQNPSDSFTSLILDMILIEPEAVKLLTDLAKTKEQMTKIRLYERVDKLAYKELGKQLSLNIKAYIAKNKPKRKAKKKKEKK